MEFINKYFVDVVKNHYIEFTGKADREQFWYFFLINLALFFVLWIALLILVAIFAILSSSLAFYLGGLLWLAYMIIAFGLLLPNLGIAARRLTDAGFEWWMCFGLLIPFVNLAILVLCALPAKSK